VDYDGHAPPVALFDDLRMIGWHPPAAAPPPREAIDWNRPDPERGVDYTVRPWRVRAATVAPPDGSGPRGAWTDAEEGPFLAALRGVLARHGVVIDGEPTASGAEAAGRAEARPAPERAGISVLLRAVVEPELEPALRRVLDGRSLPYRSQPTSVSVAQRYRGRAFAMDLPAVALEVVLDTADLETLRTQLAALGLDDGRHQVEVCPLDPVPTADEAAAGPLADVTPILRNRGVA
jgi:hypothetical protein